MPIRDIDQYKDLEKQIVLMRSLRFLRPLYRLLGEKGKSAIEALDRMPEMERQFESIRSTADEFNTYFMPRGWIAHEYLNQTVAGRAIALAKSGDLDAGEQVLIESIDREALRLPLMRVGRMVEFRQRKELLTLALEDHCAGRYHASIMPVIAQVEGIVYDLTGKPFYVNEYGDASHLLIDNTIVGHIEGIAALAAKLSENRPTTTSEQLDRLYRHGIMHGRDLQYYSQANSARAFGLLMALCSFALLFDTERLKRLVLVEPRPTQPPTLRESFRKLQAVHDPSTYYLAFPTPPSSRKRKYRLPLAPDQPLSTIPLFSARSLARELQGLGFECPSPTRIVRGLAWVMSWRSVGADYRADIWGSNADAISRVTFTFRGTPGYATDAHGIDFLTFVASTMYQGAEPLRAQAWVREHYGKADAETVIGGARLRLSHFEPDVYLRIMAVNEELD